jgi:hypothetical protein
MAVDKDRGGEIEAAQQDGAHEKACGDDARQTAA